MNQIQLAVRTGFRPLEVEGLAGGPIELEFFLEVPVPDPWFLLVTGDRMTGRPGGFSFAASFAGVPLGDPYADVPDLGGPAGVVEITSSRPWHQPVLLNEFVQLEDVRDRLQPGEAGRLTVLCQRTLPLGHDEKSVLGSAAAYLPAESVLEFELRRDDAGLGALVDDLVTRVSSGPATEREHPLRLLLALRSPVAVERWRVLSSHPDPSVATRVRNALSGRSR